MILWIDFLMLFVLVLVTFVVLILKVTAKEITLWVLTDHQIFPELNLDEVKRSQGMHITFVTTAKNDEECIELLRLLGLPFKNLPVAVAA